MGRNPGEVRPLVIASECAAARHPQNTLVGFRQCVANNLDGIEFDVHLTADSEVVVQHDYRLNPNITRTGAGEWLERPTPALVDMTLDALQSYDVGRYRPRSREARLYPDYLPCDGERIPTLDDFIAVLQDTPTARSELWLELKTTPFDRQISSDPVELLNRVLEKLIQAELTSRTVLLAFEWDLLIAAKFAAPRIRTNYLSLEASRLMALYPSLPNLDVNLLYGKCAPSRYADIPSAVAAAGGDWWGPLVHDVSITDVATAHEAGVMVNAWGVEPTVSTLEAARVAGFDAVTVDHPEVAIEFFA